MECLQSMNLILDSNNFPMEQSFPHFQDDLSSSFFSWKIDHLLHNKVGLSSNQRKKDYDKYQRDRAQAHFQIYDKQWQFYFP